VRVKKRTMAFFVPQKKQNRTIYKIEDLNQDMLKKELKYEQEMELRPFEEIYNKRMQMGKTSD
jgi:hypothetical protein